MSVNDPAENLSPPAATEARGRWWVLPLIVLLGAGLRFAFLGRPGIWGDEGATYGRVNGSFYQLLEVLQYDGFAPLHYELYWVLARYLTLTPGLMRLWPAIAGTLTVPAMYLLARQMLARREALVATLLAATSAFLLYYSRDAKMYAPLWLFVTLSMGCFLWWLNRSAARHPGARLAWWCWIFCTMAAAGIHTPGLVVLAVQPVALAVHRAGRAGWRSAVRWAMFVLGVGIILAGPLYHYTTFNKWAQRIEERGWNASMLQWVDMYNEGRDLPKLLRYTGTSFAVAWEWPDKPYEVEGISPAVRGAFQGYAAGLAAALALGLFPWSRAWTLAKGQVERLRGGDREPTPWEEPAAPSPRAGEPGAEEPRVGTFAALTILATWIVLPVYATYVISTDGPAAPWALPGWVIGSGPAVWGVAVLAAAGLAGTVRRGSDLLRLTGVLAFLFGACAAVYLGITFHRAYEFTSLLRMPVARSVPLEGKSLWMPRYLGAVVPALVLSAAVLLCRLPVGVRHVAIAAVVMANLANFGAKVYLDPEPPMRKIVTEAVADAWGTEGASREGGAPPVYFRMWGGAGFEPGTATFGGPVGKYHLSTMMQDPLDPPTFRGSSFGWGRAGGIGDFLPLRTDFRARPLREALAKRAGKPGDHVVFWELIDVAPTLLSRGQGRGRQGNAAPPVTTAESVPDPLATALGADWQRTGVTLYPTYDHWTWRRLGTFVRHEYTRKAAAAPTTTRPVGTPRR